MKFDSVSHANIKFIPSDPGRDRSETSSRSPGSNVTVNVINTEVPPQPSYFEVGITVHFNTGPEDARERSVYFPVFVEGDRDQDYRGIEDEAMGRLPSELRKLADGLEEFLSGLDDFPAPSGL